MDIEEKEVPSIFIGKKPLSRYLASCFTIVNRNQSRIWVEGMGQSIAKAVDVANYFKRLYSKGDVRIVDVQMDLVEREVVHGLPKHVSRLRILLEVSK